MTNSQTTKNRYFDRNGEELWPHNMLPDMSNVHSVIRTQKMTMKEFKEVFPNERI